MGERGLQRHIHKIQLENVQKMKGFIPSVFGNFSCNNCTPPSHHKQWWTPQGLMLILEPQLMYEVTRNQVLGPKKTTNATKNTEFSPIFHANWSFFTPHAPPCHFHPPQPNSNITFKHLNSFQRRFYAISCFYMQENNQFL